MPVRRRRRDPRFVHPAALLADLLALRRSQMREEFVETPVTGVFPVKLDRAAKHHPRRLHFPRFGLRREQHVQRRDLARGLQRGAKEKRAGGPVAREQARPRDRRKRDRAEQLGIVGKPVAVIGVGPCPVEYVFSVGMRLEIERHCPDERRSLPQGEVPWLPSRAYTRAPGLVKSMEKLVTQAGMLPDERVPRLRLDVRERFDEFDRGGVFLHAIGKAKTPIRSGE